MWWRRFALALAGLALAASLLADDAPALNRSLYVPVRFAPCEHLEHAVLYRGDQPIQELPGTHVFQFTYYPNLERLEPELERVRIEGEHDDEPFRSEVIVTPTAVYVGSKKIDLDFEERVARRRNRVDLRHETVELSLKCSRACTRRAPVTTDE
jgi:hypothetical protein